MGEYVWTTYTFGGKLKASLAASLDDLEKDFESVDTLDSGVRVLAGQCNYGFHKELETFLTENKLTYAVHWCTALGVFPSGLRSYVPGRRYEEFDANDDGDIVLTAGFIKDKIEKGLKIEGLLPFIEPPEIPPLTLIDEPAAVG